MRKVSFRVRNFDKEQFLTFNIDNDASLDEDLLDFLEDEDPKGIVPVIFEEGEEFDTFSYNITDKIHLIDLSNQEINAEMVLKVLHSLVLALIDMAEYRVPLSYLVLNRNYIYVDSDYHIEFICIPLEDMQEETDINVFLRNLIASLRFDPMENGDYVAKMLTYINNTAVFNLHNMVTLIEELMEQMDVEILEEESADIYVDYQEVEESEEDTDAVQEEAAEEPLDEESVEEESLDEESVEEELLDEESAEEELLNEESAEEESAEEELLDEEVVEEDLEAEEEPAEEVIQAQFKEAEAIEEPEDGEESDQEEELQAVQSDALEMDENEDFSKEDITEEPPKAMGKFKLKEVPEDDLTEEPEDEILEAVEDLEAEEPEDDLTEEPVLEEPEEIDLIQVPKEEPEEELEDDLLEEPEEEEKPLPEEPVQKKPRFKTKEATITGVVIEDELDEFLAEKEREDQLAQWEENGLKIKKNIKVNRATLLKNTQEELKAEEPEEPKATEGDKAKEPVTSPATGTAGAVTPAAATPAPKANPYLIRVNTDERIMITKQSFKLGKASMGIDYAIKGNSAISRVHAIITSKDGIYYIQDNKSTNHTFVNGKMIPEGQTELLTHDCKIMLGDEEFIFKLR